MIVHGGAGNGKSAVIKVAAIHAEKILRQSGSHPNKPRVLILGPTGKAASLIGKFPYFYFSVQQISKIQFFYFHRWNNFPLSL